MKRDAGGEDLVKKSSWFVKESALLFLNGVNGAAPLQGKQPIRSVSLCTNSLTNHKDMNINGVLPHNGRL